MDCEWALDESCLGDDWAALDNEVKERATSLAVDTLRRLTAYRVGGCPVVVRPIVKEGCCFIPTMDTPTLHPGVDASGQWVNNCTTRPLTSNREVALPAPVGRVDEVKVDGEVVDPNHYRIDNGHLLTWTQPGPPPWPSSQDVTLPDTEEGTFAVTYLNAYPVGSAGENAAGVLAKEFARACVGGKCRLPAGVTNITRQGISMEIPTGAFPNGMTGIREVDAFIALWNPEARSQPTRVWSPDLNLPRRTGS